MAELSTQEQPWTEDRQQPLASARRTAETTKPAEAGFAAKREIKLVGARGFEPPTTTTPRSVRSQAMSLIRRLFPAFLLAFLIAFSFPQYQLLTGGFCCAHCVQAADR
ncbi:MAG: hypothetical protein EPN60_04350 [Nevskiaceae bacterium]|nr:MAG: hypothetical protein EPN60_04350 [Nevskiaceae bacterium]